MASFPTTKHNTLGQIIPYFQMSTDTSQAIFYLVRYVADPAEPAEPTHLNL